MKRFTATTEERYVWNCPECGQICDECYEEIDAGVQVECEHCGEVSLCEGVAR